MAAINAHRLILVFLVTWLVLLVASNHTKTLCREIGWIMDWRIREIYAGSKPRLFPMARVVDVDTQIFYILFQLDRFIKDGEADCFMFPLMRSKEGLSFIGVNTESFFMAPLLDFSSLILERAYWAVSNHVLICVPSIVMTVPPAYPRHQIWWSVSRFIKELATRFHNKGDKIPPRGQPLDTIHVNVCPWWPLGENGLRALLELW